MDRYNDLYALKDLLESLLSVGFPTILFLAALDVAYRKQRDGAISAIRAITALTLYSWYAITVLQFFRNTHFIDKSFVTPDGSFNIFLFSIASSLLGWFMINWIARRLSRLVEL